MPWTGSGQNLYDFFVNNIKDMKKGIVEQGGLNNTNLLVLIANSMDKSHLINVTYCDGKCYNDTLKTYDDGAMDTSDKMSALLNKVAEVAPAHIYSMMIGSHGVGWIYYETASESVQRRIAADRDRNEKMGLPITRQSRRNTTFQSKPFAVPPLRRLLYGEYRNGLRIEPCYRLSHRLSNRDNGARNALS